jgi:hypothetical protein
MAARQSDRAFVDREAETAHGRERPEIAQPRSGIRFRDPDEEAIEIATHVARRLEVAKSLARLAAGVFQEQAVVAIARSQSLAKAAAGAAKHAAMGAVARRLRTIEDEPAHDPETMRDDAC